MAGVTLTLGEGNMDVLGLGSLFCLGMAGKAQVHVFQIQEFLILSRMGGMAREASFCASDWGMIKGHLLFLLFVAFEAEEIIRFQHEARVFRCMRVMAGHTLTVLEGYVIHGPSGLEACVVVTGGTELATTLFGLKRLSC